MNRRSWQPAGEPVPQSVLVGGPAPAPATTNLAELLARAARRNTTEAIRFIAVDGVESGMSYADLLADAARVLKGMRKSGALPGERVVLLIEGNRDLLVAFWACVLGGFVVAPVTVRAAGGRHAALQTAARMRRDLGCRWLLTDDAAEAAAGPDGMLGTVDSLRGETADTDFAAVSWNDTALLTMTAGSTGDPKAVLLSHGNILSRTAATVEDNALGPATVTFNWMPLDHVGGLVMFHLRDVWLACVQLHADRSWILHDPLRWLDTVDAHRVTIAWGTDSALDLIASRAADYAGRSWDLACLGYVMNGGEPVRARTVRRFHAVLSPHGLPAGAMRPGWGMTETTGGVVDYRVDPTALRDGTRFVPVGMPHPGVSIRVVDDAGRVVRVGTVGRLQVRGESVSPGYADASGSHPATVDGWLDTADLAYVADGALTVIGSTADALWIDDVLHQGHEIEATLAELVFVDRSHVAACLVDSPTTGAQELVVAYHGDGSVSPAEAAAEIRAAVSAGHGLTVDRVVTVADYDFPKTRTGKPQRWRLRALLRSRSGVTATPTAP